ncbi:hypothetical protein SASPL_151362 [Salvia splendens]|uniref:Jasmonate O-methyltransferase n=1 Tax=Salvia splendens TaxID=180675 RepID=A0A8X8W7U4_SALSN|nr:hypothetical protein SASPL_151362 [Salvia splendens]
MDFNYSRHFSMNGGDGPLSYIKNSSYQRGVLEAAKAIIEEEIATKLDISTNSFFCIADFGCSTGNNSFPAMHTIIEAVKRKYESSDLKTPDFYVWFNDVVSNDFNTLFRSLPPDRSYKVAAVAGDFHGYLLPPSSVHFAYSSYAIHWLMEVPKAAGGHKRLYGVEREEVYEAYLNKFERDLEAFFKCRGCRNGERWDYGSSNSCTASLLGPTNRVHCCVSDRTSQIFPSRYGQEGQTNVTFIRAKVNFKGKL